MGKVEPPQTRSRDELTCRPTLASVKTNFSMQGILTVRGISDPTGRCVNPAAETDSLRKN